MSKKFDRKSFLKLLGLGGGAAVVGVASLTLDQRKAGARAYSEVLAKSADPTFSSIGVGLPSVTSDPSLTGNTGVVWWRSDKNRIASTDGSTAYYFTKSGDIVNADISASAAIGPTKLGTITDASTLDQSGAGSTLEVKSGGVGTTQLANAAVTPAKSSSGAVSFGAFDYVIRNFSGTYKAWDDTGTQAGSNRTELGALLNDIDALTSAGGMTHIKLKGQQAAATYSMTTAFTPGQNKGYWLQGDGPLSSIIAYTPSSGNVIDGSVNWTSINNSAQPYQRIFFTDMWIQAAATTGTVFNLANCHQFRAEHFRVTGNVGSSPKAGSKGLYLPTNRNNNMHWLSDGIFDGFDYLNQVGADHISWVGMDYGQYTSYGIRIDQGGFGADGPLSLWMTGVHDQCPTNSTPNTAFIYDNRTAPSGASQVAEQILRVDGLDIELNTRGPFQTVNSAYYMFTSYNFNSASAAPSNFVNTNMPPLVMVNNSTAKGVALDVGSTGARGVVRLWDATKAANYYLYIDNGAVVVSASNPT